MAETITIVLDARDEGLSAATSKAKTELGGVGAAARSLNSDGAHGAAGVKNIGQEIQNTTGHAERGTGVLGSLRGAFGNVATIASGFVVAQGLMKLPGLLGGALDAASDLGESMSKMKTVFGDSGSEVEAWSKTTASSMGISQQAALEITGTYGNLFTAMGMGQKPAADMSMSLVGLAGDLASFNNMDPTQVLDKLRAGLIGEAEPLRALGVNMNAAVVEAKAMEMGLEKVGGKFTDASLITARYAIIMDQTKTAQGDFGRTADGAANRTRILNAQMADLSATIGAKLLPAKIALLDVLATKLLPALSTVIDYFSQFYDKVVALAGAGWEKISGPLATIAGLAWDGIVSGVDALKDLALAAADMAAVGWDRISGPVEEMAASLERMAKAKWQDISPQVSALGSAMGGVDMQTFADGFSAVKDALQPVADILTPFVDRILKDLKDQFNDLKESLTPLGEALGELVVAFAPLEPLVKPLGELLGVIIVANIMALLTVVDLAVIAIGTTLELAIDGLVIAIGLLVPVIEGIATLLGTIPDAVLLAKDGLVAAWDRVRGVFTSASDFVTDWVERLWKPLAVILASPIILAAAAILIPIAAIQTAFTALWAMVGGWVTSAWDTLQDLLLAPINAAVGLLTAAWGLVMGTFDALWGTVSGWVSSTWSTLTGLLTGPIHAAVDLLQTIGADFLAIGGLIIGGIVSGIAAVADRIRDAIWAAKDAALRGLGAVTDWLVGVGWDIVRGLAAGIEGAAGLVMDAVNRLTGFIPGWAKKILGIMSPSTVMAEQVGTPIVMGIVKGMDAALPALKDAVSRVVDVVAAAAAFDPAAPASSYPKPPSGGGRRDGSQSYNPFDYIMGPHGLRSTTPSFATTGGGQFGPATPYMAQGPDGGWYDTRLHGMPGTGGIESWTALIKAGWTPGLGTKEGPITLQREYALAAGGGSIVQFPKAAEGGIIRKRPGGTPVIVGEGLYDEAIVPLDQGQVGRSGITVVMPNYLGSRSEVVREIVLEMRRQGIDV